ncbi:hypothetical protein ACG9Y2_20490, partial [Acinetobacter baumannii]
TGRIANYNINTIGDSLAWVTRTEHGQGQIVMTEVFSTLRISNHAIETDISSYQNIKDAYGFAYQENGHAFLLMTFTSAKMNWCY